MSVENPAPRKKNGLLIALVAGAFALGALGAAALLVNIAERKQEAKNPGSSLYRRWPCRCFP